MTNAVVDSGGSWWASWRRASVMSTSSRPCIGTMRRPARTAAVTARRLDGKVSTSRPRGRTAGSAASPLLPGPRPAGLTSQGLHGVLVEELLDRHEGRADPAGQVRGVTHTDL